MAGTMERDPRVERVYFTGLRDCVNLNWKSTHPNPWRPPSQMDQFYGVHKSKYRVYHGNQDFPMEATTNYLRLESFSYRFTKMAWRSFLVGSLYATLDVSFFTKLTSPRAIIARYLYLVPPIMAAPLSFTTTNELLANSFGDKFWIYPASAVPPAVIWGMYRQAFSTGLRVFTWTALAASLLKFNADTGDMLFNSNFTYGRNDIDYDRPESEWVHGWKWSWRSKKYIDTDPGPAYDRFEPGSELSKYEKR